MRCSGILLALFAASSLWACGEQYAQVPATTTPAAVEGRESQSQADPKGKVPKGAERAARVFLRAYLPYSYGRDGVENFGSVTPALRRQLQQQPPRPTAEMRKARPRVVDLRAMRVQRERVLLFADVEDGIQPYSLLLTLVRHGDGWVVADVVGA